MDFVEFDVDVPTDMAKLLGNAVIAAITKPFRDLNKIYMHNSEVVRGLAIETEEGQIVRLTIMVDHDEDVGQFTQKPVHEQQAALIQLKRMTGKTIHPSDYMGNEEAEDKINAIMIESWKKLAVNILDAYVPPVIMQRTAANHEYRFPLAGHGYELGLYRRLEVEDPTFEPL